ncbi:MAG: sulfotransferase [Lewinellaceae bacterium]|nr:sulfotransferase [Saprospiraceae bacterium]MCB9338139.1 sulfotransferase [Lewinellaceae bacterium]
MHIDFKNSPRFLPHFLSGSTPGNIWKLLKDNHFQVEGRFWPKLVLSILIAFFNLPFVWIERLLYSRRIEKTEVPPPIFILGYLRSGTTYLHYLLSKDPSLAFCKVYECMGPHVLFTSGRVMRNIGRLVLPKTRPMDNMEFGAEMPKEEEFAMCNIGPASMIHANFFPKNFRHYFRRTVTFEEGPEHEEVWKKDFLWLLKKLTLKNKGKRLLLKSPYNTGRLRVLKAMFPDAKFIYIHRHPHQVFSSNERLYEGILPELALQTVGHEEMEEAIFYSYEETVKHYLREREGLPSSQLAEVAYGDFFKDQKGHLKRLYEQLGLGDFDSIWPHFQEYIVEQKGYKTNKYGLTPGQEKAVYARWKFAFDAFGYGSAGA